MAVLKATAAFAAAQGKGGVLRTVRIGDLVDADDPIVKGRESFFEPVSATPSAPVWTAQGRTEQATAAPGEKRTTRLPKAPKA